LTKALHLAGCRERFESPLHRALAGPERKRQGGTRPRLTVDEESEHIRMFLFHWPRQYHDVARAPRRQGKPKLRRADAG
jgi:hypothetical protein